MSLQHATPTMHLLRTMRSRDVSWAEVQEVLEGYTTRRPAAPFHRGRPTPNRFMYTKDQLTVLVDESTDPPAILTVLLASQEQWSDADVRARNERA